MKFCLFLKAIVIVLLNRIGCSAFDASVSQATATPMSIVLIVADDLRSDVMSVYGGPVPTPRLEQLAMRGTKFRRAICGYPICHVSRTELLTGRPMVSHATKGNAIPFLGEWSTLPATLRAEGWQTVYSGKWHAEGTPISRGYAITSALFSSGGADGKSSTLSTTSSGRPVTGYVGWTFKTGSNQSQPEFGIGLTSNTDSIIAKGAIKAIQEVSNQAVFVHVNFTAPHDPLHWPEGMAERYRSAQIVLPSNYRDQHPFDHGNLHGRDEMIVPAPRSKIDVQTERAIYYALVERLDSHVGSILDATEQAGGNWLTIFISDQGLALGSHGLMGKQNQYEHTLNTPMIMAGCRIPQGKTIDAQCALRDLFPTICELTGLPIPNSVTGKSIVPLMRGDTDSIHEYQYSYFADSQRCIRSDDGWKLIWYPRSGQTQLFHIPSDPNEWMDLSESSPHRERKANLQNRLKQWLAEQGDPLIVKNE